VIVAEIELPCEESAFRVPEWVGREVTNDPSFQKINLLNERLARKGSQVPPLALSLFTPAEIS
jgi:CYTH domain-containing protein